MRKRLMIVFLGISSLGFAQDAGQENSKLKWMPKAGTTMKYMITRSANQDGVPITQSSTSEWTISEVRANGDVVFTRKDSDLKAMRGTEDMSTSWKIPTSSTVVYSSVGDLVEWTSDPPLMSPRMEYSYVFIYPDREMRVGETWTKTWAANPSRSLYGRATTYTYDGTERIGQWDTFRYKVSSKESDAPTNMTTDGTIWVSQLDGSLVKATFTTTNGEWVAGLVPSSTTTEIVRVQ